MGHHSSIGEELETYDFHFGSPTVYDYIGIELKKLSASTTVTDGIMHFHRHFAHNDVDGLAIFLEQRPNYFLIESEIISLAERYGDDGKAKLDQCTETLLVPVILKENYYYICPSQENALIYRVHHPTDIFFTSKGHDVLKCLITKAFTTHKSFSWCYAGEISIVLPKQSKPVTNWDKKTDYDIGICVPYPIVSTNKVLDDSWCSVQLVHLNDSKYIKEVIINYEESTDNEE
eukprot:CAMPEP_0201731092 /NCGR_PEP_ID=MMETSP0593-20130828/24546_1 /ASSEMBLY_ACC=CAM_ASM_000672 /TAXON_ID=267983 /ORGANISM="Skeletonema japonicum, Strain CCMP2506" /LENGTH=231 /DNA_ID=CAMNT_0048223797 /DNA_START=199 /DNA_END=894 /DNA_ORIENTATION=+